VPFPIVPAQGKGKGGGGGGTSLKKTRRGGRRVPFLSCQSRLKGKGEKKGRGNGELEGKEGENCLVPSRKEKEKKKDFLSPYPIRGGRGALFCVITKKRKRTVRDPSHCRKKEKGGKEREKVLRKLIQERKTDTGKVPKKKRGPANVTSFQCREKAPKPVWKRKVSAGGEREK